MISLIDVFVILIIHYVADFIVQTDWQAQNKSKSNYALTFHVTTYSLCWVIPMTIMFYVSGFYALNAIALSLFFTAFTAIFHWGTDYFTSRVNSFLLNKKDHHGFFVCVGLDQVLHYIQLFTLYYFLKNT